MVKVKHIEDEIALSAIKERDFDKSTKGGAPFTALILTQSWCGQWQWMKRFLDTLSKEAIEEEVSIQILEYDTKAYFEEFLSFKESVYKNYEVPFILYYHCGELKGVSNFVSQESFLENLGLK